MFRAIQRRAIQRLHDNVKYTFPIQSDPLRAGLSVPVFAEVECEQVPRIGFFVCHIAQKLFVCFLLIFFTVPEFEFQDELFMSIIAHGNLKDSVGDCYFAVAVLQESEHNSEFYEGIVNNKGSLFPRD